MYKNIASGTNQILYCSNPLRLDGYQGCEFGCKYCFANQLRDTLKSCDPEWAMQKISDAVNGTLNQSNSAMGSFARFVSEGWPVHIGGMADPFPYSEKKLRTMWKILYQFTQTPHPIIISTKSTLPGLGEYLNLLTQMKDQLIFQMSIITSNQDFSNAIEPYTPTIEARLKTVEKLCNAGIKCFVRLQPFMLELLDEQEDLFARYKDIGVQGVIVEGLRMRPRTKYTEFEKSFYDIYSYNIRDKMVRKSVMNNSYYELSEKIAYHLVLRDFAHANNLIYLVADNDLRFMGDSPNCCGQDLITDNTNSYNITRLSFDSPNDFGFADIKDLDDDVLNFSIRGFAGAYADSLDYSILDHFKSRYNDPDWIEKLCPLYKPTYIDKNGNYHYKIDRYSELVK